MKRCLVLAIIATCAWASLEAQSGRSSGGGRLGLGFSGGGHRGFFGGSNRGFFFGPSFRPHSAFFGFRNPLFHGTGLHGFTSIRLGDSRGLFFLDNGFDHGFRSRPGRFGYGYSYPSPLGASYGYRSPALGDGFVATWRDRTPWMLEDRDEADKEDGFADSALLRKGMSQEEVMLALGSPVQRFETAGREIWKYSGYSLVFEGRTLQRIR